MVYKINPFLERMSEATASDQEFVSLFSPEILKKLGEGVFSAKLHIFRSSPGAGKTTLLRTFTPSVLKAFWNSRNASPELRESFQKLAGYGVLNDEQKPQFLGVMLSCSSGYSDLPFDMEFQREEHFKALLDCRVVLKSLRSLGNLSGVGSLDGLKNITLDYNDDCLELKFIPRKVNAYELMKWAEETEKHFYAQIDQLIDHSEIRIPSQKRIEGLIWLQNVKFNFKEKEIAINRLLMFDDVHKLRKKQRSILIEELILQRVKIPIWLSERLIALGDELLSQGVRDGRDVKEYSLEDMWNDKKGTSSQFLKFAQNILDRRVASQNYIPVTTFSQFLRDTITTDEIVDKLKKGKHDFDVDIDKYKLNPRYKDWFQNIEDSSLVKNLSFEMIRRLYVLRILIIRDQKNSQATIPFPLSEEEFIDRNDSQIKGAAEIFIHKNLNIPYYFGIKKLCNIASNNIEELLFLSAAIFDGLKDKQSIADAELVLTAEEQEKLIKKVAKAKYEFIPKSHTNGSKAQKLINSIASFCIERSFLENAPYAPGVTGIRLSNLDLSNLSNESKLSKNQYSILANVLSECIAENLLIMKPSSASTSREEGKIFYLNRIFCVHYGLPLQQGGWQQITLLQLLRWIESSKKPKIKLDLFL